MENEIIVFHLKNILWIFFENSYDSKHSCVPVMDKPKEEDESVPEWRLVDI